MSIIIKSIPTTAQAMVLIVSVSRTNVAESMHEYESYKRADVGNMGREPVTSSVASGECVYIASAATRTPRNYIYYQHMCRSGIM